MHWRLRRGFGSCQRLGLGRVDPPAHGLTIAERPHMRPKLIDLDPAARPMAAVPHGSDDVLTHFDQLVDLGAVIREARLKLRHNAPDAGMPTIGLVRIEPEAV